MNRIKQTLIFVAVLALSFAGGLAAQAVPTLQLDIDGTDVVYNDAPGVETIQTTNDSFDVYLYLTPGPKADVSALLGQTYYVSIALTPQTGPTGGMLGSFDVNGSTVSVTSDMSYGTPPIESNLSFDPGDLSKHGVFPTFFYQVAVQFDAAHQTAIYNTQDTRFADGFDPTGAGMYYTVLSIDKSNLNDSTQLHFDGYDTVAKDGGDIDANDFVPFSHDAESISPPIPEPTGVLLFSAGLLMVGRSLRRQR
jgi:hypothetical protein